MVNAAHLHNPLTLAYLGDAILDLHVREHVILKLQAKPNTLHRAATFYVSAKSQAQTFDALVDAQYFTEQELDVLMRGRNAKSHTKAKNTDVVTYKKSTGLEAVIGYLQLAGEEGRLKELLDQIVALCEERELK
ncbi:Mini-ribonuclease 3 [Macrococcus equipercicus]|uniref:Mini-ribonuclease 3 n=1 Tax=Macrococcus equipercicus TaxID=69967 RepID=A0A9Q9BM68_9STAP|nr:ribonuclease III domain-containing protein [Macrococcus equipercicus]KAA1039407.1 ribonuclease III [Macrococcus equipercicus]UTH13700.1 ribonuclease III [Macrococcus equipercicus]